MSVTPQDWRVTALLAVRKMVEHVTRAQSRVDADMADVLRDCWLAHRSSGAAVGSWAQGMLADGRSWSDVGRSIDLTGRQAQAVLDPLISEAWLEVQRRLPHAAAPDDAPVPDPVPTVQASRTVLVLNGPNLNLLGLREPAIYGSATLSDVERLCRATADELGVSVDFRQSNHEGVLIDAVHEARAAMSAIVINPGGSSHTSVALRDALSASDLPVVEVHVSNIHRRESFRHFSHVSQVAVAVIAGCGAQGYALALQHAAALLREPAA